MRFLVRLAVTACALWIALRVVDGLTWTGTPLGLLGVALVFGLVNALVRPLFVLFTFPVLIVTLGLFAFVINALMFWLAARVSAELGLGFGVAGFVPALLGSLVVGITSGVLNFFLGTNRRKKDDD